MTYDLVKDAILHKRQIAAMYQGLRREMCPHALGTKNGRSQALFYQFGGQSSRGLEPDGSPANWRCIPIDALSGVTVRDGAWHSANYNSRRQTCVDIIDVEVAATESDSA